MQNLENGRGKPAALALLTGQRPRNVGWLQAAGLLFGDWGTSRLYVLGIALFFAGRSAFWLIVGMSILTLASLTPRNFAVCLVERSAAASPAISTIEVRPKVGMLK